jgi:hypothetical protein
MNHEAASEKLLELAFGELPAREARAVEAHAAACDACRGELARIRETRALMARLPVEPPPERGMGVVFAAAREAAAARARKKSILPPWLWAGSVGAVAMAAVAVVSWQLAKTAPGGPAAERESELLGRGSSTETAPSPPPGERAGVRGLAVPAAPIAAAPPRPQPQVADRAKAPSAKREEVWEPSAAAPEDELRAEKGSGALGGVGAEGRAGGASGSGASVPAPSPAPAQAERNATAPMALRDEASPVPRAPAAQKARSAFAPARKSAAPAASSEAESVSGPGSVESRSFPDCPGERRRVVERDGDGRVIRYVRVGDRRTVEQRYGADGRLRAAFAIEGGLRRDLPAGAPGLVGDSRDAGIDAPPRCSAP